MLETQQHLWMARPVVFTLHCIQTYTCTASGQSHIRLFGSSLSRFPLLQVVFTLTQVPMASKVGKILNQGKALKEVRIHLCPNGKSSEGVRNFIQENYVNLKKQIPNTPILVREAQGIEPQLWARYEFGIEQNVSLSNLNSSSIFNQVKQLIGK